MIVIPNVGRIVFLESISHYPEKTDMRLEIEIRDVDWETYTELMGLFKSGDNVLVKREGGKARSESA